MKLWLKKIKPAMKRYVTNKYFVGFVILLKKQICGKCDTTNRNKPIERKISCMYAAIIIHNMKQLH